MSNYSLLPDQPMEQLLKFRIDGRTFNAKNIDELYPGLDRLLLRSLQTGDCRQLFNRLKCKLIFRSDKLNFLSALANEYGQQMLADPEHSLVHMVRIKTRLIELRMQTLT
ncbi:unnamed protein product [Rotaria magnacalcarata]|uniref:Uncharacterized protein n=1 Tax=Rotaria magnacalcarata TaxID=392030 RepID=A0A815X1V3_9BILA|nr:unnamed protein product [Rotaria magnacalcarata]